jgi:IS5 family transposase
MVQLVGPRLEEAFYESSTLRRFAGVDLGTAPAPDETTVLRFRHLLEKHDLCGAMLDAVNLHLEAKGIRIATGTIVDATIIHAPSSTKNEKKERDPAMHQTKKGKQWYFGLKAHIGVDSKEGTVHSVATSAANVSDVHMLAGSAAWRRAQGVGRRRLPGSDKGHPTGRAQGPGHDLEENEVQELRR